MGGGDNITAVQIGNSTRYFDDTIVAAGTKPQRRKKLGQQLFCRCFHLAVLVQLAPSHLRIAVQIGALQSQQLALTRFDDPLPDHVRTFALLLALQVTVF